MLGKFLERENRDFTNSMLLFYIDVPARVYSLIPLIICVILLRVRSNTEKCETFMNYYNFCSNVYGDDFKNNFSDVM